MTISELIDQLVDTMVEGLKTGDSVPGHEYVLIYNLNGGAIIVTEEELFEGLRSMGGSCSTHGPDGDRISYESTNPRGT